MVGLTLEEAADVAEGGMELAERGAGLAKERTVEVRRHTLLIWQTGVRELEEILGEVNFF
jgi:hypothetical protein